MEDREQFEKWMDQWAKASKEIAAESRSIEVEPQKPDMTPLRTSYFTGTPSSADYEDDEDGPTDDWYAIYQRSTQIDYGDDVLNEEKAESPFGDKSPPNPTRVTSAGVDQEDDETGNVHVTDNWSDGKELRDIDDLKHRIEAMERKVHESEVRKKGNRSKLESELKVLRQRVQKLSERITPTLKKNFN